MDFVGKNWGHVDYSLDIETHFVPTAVVLKDFQKPEPVHIDMDLQLDDLKYLDLQFEDLGIGDLQFEDLQYPDLPFEDLRFGDLQFEDLQLADLQFKDLKFRDSVH